MKLLDPKKQDLGLYDSDTGRSLKVKRAVDLSDKTRKLVLLYAKAVRGELVQIVVEGAFTHYFIDDLKRLDPGKEAIANFALWTGMTPEELKGLCLKHAELLRL